MPSSPSSRVLNASAPVLTVGIVTFRTDFLVLKNTLDSLRACTLPIALVIIDNTGDDAYFTALEKHTGERCVRSSANKGYGFGHNLALRYLPHAPYHLVLNPDVIVHEGCIETLLEHMQQQADLGIAMPKILHWNGSLQPLNKRDPNVFDLFARRFIPKFLHALPPIRNHMEHYVMMDYGYEQSYEVPFASGCFMLFRRSVWDAIGGFDERFFMYFEDADISRRVREIAKIRYYPQATIVHLWARCSHTSWQPTAAALKSAYQYFQKWGWKWW